MTAEEKYIKLNEYLRSLGTLAVAFSGGVDSTFLLKAAKEALGVENVLAITVRSPFFPGREAREASSWCVREEIRQVVIDFDVLSERKIRENPPDRCYHCKHKLFEKIIETAALHGIRHVAEGSNMDDCGDYRPGMRAVAELKVKSPLKDAGLFKKEIRILSRQMGLPTWDKPSFACLASRFVYGEALSKEKLSMVERAEQVLKDQQFIQFRVRVHGNLARIEVLPDDLERLFSCREEIASRLKDLGFSYVTMDLSGYRTGSMNEVLDRP